MDNVYFKVSIDNPSESVHKYILTSFNDVRYDFVSRPNGNVTMMYEIYDACYFATSKDVVSMYSRDSGKHFILNGLDGIWISIGTTVR